ncbi:hypothetical protein N7E81_04370 [Reichenbachiella carrageenanivorans]|uniref:YcxB-like protein n=1 Tax=Reichenbachiella carrageenanivorans TaxID=2979869 RepID=A0ABY6D2I6_9BACT|nr:hypothetical protein [Reichenbachiella carrageenanivorans]UXX80333.1 hypothetical protein N7E81_04370 [Reichenbachiella carrageenanivorans]
MPSIRIPSNSDFKAFFQGQKIADHPKKRAMSMLLAIVAGLLLYTGTKVTPMDEKMTYAGVLTLVYVFVGRNFMFKIKIKNLWKQKRETNPELLIDQKGVEIKHHMPEQCKTIAWADFGYYRIEESLALLYPKKTPEKWLTLSLTELENETIQDLKEMIKTNIKIAEPKK